MQCDNDNDVYFTLVIDGVTLTVRGQITHSQVVESYSVDNKMSDDRGLVKMVTWNINVKREPVIIGTSEIVVNSTMHLILLLSM